MGKAASITKSFTATLLGILADRGKIKWTDPVIKYIPDFETNEPFVTQRLTIQYLVSLRSGFLGRDTLKGLSRIDLLPQIKNLKISNSFRISQTSYNLNYTLAGLIAEMIEGKNWDTLDQIQIPQIITATWAKDYFNPIANFMTFGSGCAVSDYKGIKIIQMAGMISGSTSLLTVVPSENTGIAIQTNMAAALKV